MEFTSFAFLCLFLLKDSLGILTKYKSSQIVHNIKIYIQSAIFNNYNTEPTKSISIIDLYIEAYIAPEATES